MVKYALVVLIVGLTACAAPRGIERCVMAPLGVNAAGAPIVLMRCQPEGTAT